MNWINYKDDNLIQNSPPDRGFVLADTLPSSVYNNIEEIIFTEELFQFDTNTIINKESEIYFINLLSNSWIESPTLTFKIIFYIRDYKRGGKGSKNYFNLCIKWLLKNHLEDLRRNLKYFPIYGNWKDYLILIGTDLEQDVVKIYCDQLLKDREIVQQISSIPLDKAQIIQYEQVSLAAKWAPKEGRSIDKKYDTVKLFCNYLNINKKEYRKNIINPILDYLNILERNICSKNFSNIRYEILSSKSIKKYHNLFLKNDKKRYLEFLKNRKTINKSTIANLEELSDVFQLGEL